MEKARNIVRLVCKHVSGFKIGLPNILSCSNIGVIVREACPGSLIIADLKLADIGYTMKLVASHVIEWSDAVISHSFPGVEGALDELKEYLDSLGKRLVLVATMSNPGAARVMDKIIDDIVEVIEIVEPWGIIAPATRPDIVRYLRRRIPRVTILSPGIGVQGARPGSGINAGADYEIIGRLITASRDPAGVVESLRPVYTREE